MAHLRKWLFIKLWANNAGDCKTCGANEGYCQERQGPQVYDDHQGHVRIIWQKKCWRLIFTHRLGLQTGWPS